MLTTSLIFWPFVGALILLALDSKLAKAWALFVALAELILCAIAIA
jgi:hypothetical protein